MGWVVRDPQWVTWSRLPAQAGSSQSTQHRIVWWWFLNISSEGDSTISLVNLFQSLVSRTVKEYFLIISWCISFCLLSVLLLLDTTMKTWHHPRHPPFLSHFFFFKYFNSNEHIYLAHTSKCAIKLNEKVICTIVFWIFYNKERGK